MKPLNTAMGWLSCATVLIVAVILFGVIVDVKPTWAQSGSHITVLRELEHDTSPPLDKIPPLPPQGEATQVVPLHRTRGPFAPSQTVLDPVVQTTTSSSLSTTLGQNFLGLGTGFSGPAGSFTVNYIPPDTNGAVGETQYVQWVNASFAVFDKATGKPTYGPAAGNTLWSNFSGANRACARNNSGDPIAQYDKIAKRWVMMQPVFKSPYVICVAVSTTSDANGSYNRYAFTVPSGLFPDYPKLGVWSDGYYLTYNQFQGNSFAGAAACVMDRSKMLAGQAATMQCTTIGAQYGSILPVDFDGTTATLPPAGSPGYFLNYRTPNLLDLWKLHVDWSNANNSTLTGPVSLQVENFNEACGGADCVPQAGTSQTLDSLGDRLMYRLAYRNLGDHESLVVTHSVDPGSGNSGSGIRWYELRDPNGSPSVVQQSTYVPDSDYRWMPSIAMDKFGNIAMGYSVSASTMSPTIRYTGRLSTDPLNEMQAEKDLLADASIVHGSQTTYNRWGDYSSMTVDPVDDCTFWYTTEYQPTDGFLWSTRIASFSFDGCSSTTGTPDFSISASPSSLTLTQGQSSSSAITATPLNGFTDTVNFSVDVSSCPTTNACTISSTGSESAMLTVTTDATTPAGSYNVKVTGTSAKDASLTHSLTVGLTVKTKRGKK